MALLQTCIDSGTLSSSSVCRRSFPSRRFRPNIMVSPLLSSFAFFFLVPRSAAGDDPVGASVAIASCGAASDGPPFGRVDEAPAAPACVALPDGPEASPLTTAVDVDGAWFTVGSSSTPCPAELPGVVAGCCAGADDASPLCLSLDLLPILRRISYTRPTRTPRTPPRRLSPMLLSPGHLALWSTWWSWTPSHVWTKSLEAA